MNGPRFSFLPDDSDQPHAGRGAAEMPEALRQRTIATIRDALAHDGLPDNVAEQFKQQLAFWESVRSSDA